MKRTSTLGALALAFAFFPLHAFATGTAFVSIIATGEATVTLTGPDGSTTTNTTSSGDLVLSPKSDGPHKIKIAVGGKSYDGDVIIPANGQVRVIFNPNGSPAFESYVAAVEELTVTAQRIEESIQKVPVAVTAFDNRQLEIKQIANLQQASYATPNLWMEKNTATSSGSRAAIRGIGEDESFFTSDTPVGIYIDDIYIPRQNGAQFDLYELERLEILRGPQGTLYGRNTSAGAIKLVTKQPGNQRRFNADGSFGSFTRTDGRASLNLPIGETSALQIAGLVRKHKGYDINTVNGADVNDQDVTGGRAALRLSPSPKFTAIFAGDFVRERSTPGYAQAFVMQGPFLSTAFPFPVVANGAAGFGVGKTDINQQLDGDSNIHTLQSDLTDPINDNDLSGFSASLSYALNDRTTLKSITAVRKMTHMILTDADGRVGNFLGSPNPAFHLFQDQKQSQWSEELQVTGSPSSSFRYVAGAYLFGEKNDQLTENIIFTQRGRSNHWLVNGETKSFAGYASLTYQANEKLSLTGGGRYTNDDKDFLSQVFLPTGSPVTRANPSNNPLLVCARSTVVNTTDVLAGACTGASPAGFSTQAVRKQLNATFSAFTPRFAVDYAATPTTIVYGSYSRGFKSGAFDGRSNTGFAVLSLLPIKAEKINSYEAGLKTDFAKGKARLNVAAFFNDFQDLQGTGTDPNGNFYRTTLGNVETRGIEFESRVVPATGLEFFGQLSLLKTEYKKVTFDQVRLCGNLNTSGRKLELKMSPPHSYQVGAVYTTPAADHGRFSFGGTMSGKGRFWHTSCNGDTGSEDGFTLFDAQVAWESRDNRIRIAAVGENLADEKYLIGSFAVGGVRMSSGYFNPPRRFAVNVRYAFN